MPIVKFIGERFLKKKTEKEILAEEQIDDIKNNLLEVKQNEFNRIGKTKCKGRYE